LWEVTSLLAGVRTGIFQRMNPVTQLLNAIHQGDPHAADELLPLVYDELHQLAAAKLGRESPGQTLQATALVHEAYLRLVASPGRESGEEPAWDGRGHFFAAAAEAMRRILVEQARRKKRLKRGGDRERQELDPSEIAAPEVSEDLLALDEALERFTAVDPMAAELVKLRYFAGMTIPEAAELLGVSPRTADAWWAYARAWLHATIRGDGDS
jgi:RNA polymerase sigma factor (TIGR02999 family)